MESRLISARELAKRMGLSQRAIRGRALREGWVGVLRQDDDGRVRRYYRLDEASQPERPPQATVEASMEATLANPALHELKAIRELLERLVAAVEAPAIATMAATEATASEASVDSVAEAEAAAPDGVPAPDSFNPSRWEGAALRAWRKRNGVRQGELAGMVGVSKRSIGAWEREESEPRPEYLLKLRNAGFPVAA